MEKLSIKFDSFDGNTAVAISVRGSVGAVYSRPPNYIDILYSPSTPKMILCAEKSTLAMRDKIHVYNYLYVKTFEAIPESAQSVLHVLRADTNGHVVSGFLVLIDITTEAFLPAET